MRTSRSFLAVAVIVLNLFGFLSLAAAVKSPAGTSHPRPGQDTLLPDEAEKVQRDASAAPVLGPAPRLDPITRFLPPIDPWVQSGFGWGDVATRDDGAPLCTTGRMPTTNCDPAGPRPFLHAGLDAMPAADRSVKASATGRVVSARQSFLSVIGGSPGESGGVIVIEHDMDGDPSTRDDLLQTIYEHVVPLVSTGDIVAQGQVIARTSTVRGEHLHFGVRRAPFDPADLDVYRNILPPSGTTGCVPCTGLPLPVPAFPERWEDPADLFREPPSWAELLEGGDEGAGDVVETPDGYLVGGWTRAADIGGDPPSVDMWLVRLDGSGRILSQRAYGTPDTETIRRLLRTADGGYLALGFSLVPERPAPLLVKFDAATQGIEWQRSYLIGGGAWGNDLRATPDGGYVMAGAILQGGTRKALILKLDSAGGVQWARTLQDVFRLLDAVTIAPSADGGYGVAMTASVSGRSGTDLEFARLDSSGHLISAWSYQDPARSGDEIAGQIEATPDGGFMIVGSAPWTGPLQGLWFLKIRPDGSIEQEHVYTTMGQEPGFRMAPSRDGGYFLLSRTNSTDINRRDVLVIKVDADGRILGQKALDGRGGLDTGAAIVSTQDGGIVVLGGQDISCLNCSALQPFNLLVAKMSGDLETSTGCAVDTQAGPGFRSSIVTGQVLREDSPTIESPAADLAAVDTAARTLPCDEGSYGPPPVIRSLSTQFAPRSVACDYTSMLEEVLCQFGIFDAQATMPIVLGGMVDDLHLEARVTDDDSTPDLNDIVEVKATLQGPDFPITFSLLDDGSSATVLRQQFNPYFGEVCFEDPSQAFCACFAAKYPTESGDPVPGDSVYARQGALVNSFLPSLLLPDCFMSVSRREPFLLPAMTSVDISLQAIDRIGNVSVWPEPVTITTGTNALGCSGDACGCCLLLGLSGGMSIEGCAGLEGMPSSQFPSGLCKGLFGP